MSVPTPILQYNLSDASVKGLLPSGYTPLAYIESSGTQWINSGIALNEATSTYTFSCRVGASTRDGYAHSFFGMASYQTGMMGIYHYTNNNYYAFYIKGQAKSPTNYVIPKGNIFDFYLKMDLSNNTYESKIDKDTLKSGSFNAMTDTTTTIRVFKSDDFSGGYWKCYYFRIAKDNVLQVDLVPARRDSDGVIGMYDLVSRTFKTNSGSGTFIAGPELAVGKGGGKSLPEEYQQVEYLQMAPGQYINTGQTVAANDVTKTEAWMWYASGNTRDLMGWSGAAADYWGCTAGSAWEKVTGVSPITQRQKVTYNYTATTAGTYQIGALTGGYSTRTKYIEQVKITIGDSLKRNLYACYRKSDMKPGMYDTVNGVFYTNAGSGEFILGPSITNYYTSELNAGSGTQQGFYTNLSGIYDSSKGWVADFGPSGGTPKMKVPVFPSGLSNCSIAFWHKNVGNNVQWLPFTGQSNSYYLAAQYNGVSATYHSNAGSPTLYQDGVQTTLFSMDTNWHFFVISGANLSSWTQFHVNNYGGSWSGGGLYSNIMIFNTALTAAQVKELYGK